MSTFYRPVCLFIRIKKGEKLKLCIKEVIPQLGFKPVPLGPVQVPVSILYKVCNFGMNEMDEFWHNLSLGII